MRALMVLVALVAVPFAAGVAQGNPERSKQCAKFAAHDSDKSAGQDKEHSKQCPPADPPPPPQPPPPTSSCGPTVSGNATISGQVTNSSFVADVGVCIQIFTWDPITSLAGTLVAGAVTDALGNYSASVSTNGGSYVVCALVPTGSAQSWPGTGMGFPSCPGGLAGYGGFPLLPGDTWLMLSFTI